MPRTPGYERILLLIWSMSSGSGTRPRSGLTASFTRPKPLQQMKMPTARPVQPSRSTPVVAETMAAARTAAEVMTSFLLSAAVAASVSEEILLDQHGGDERYDGCDAKLRGLRASDLCHGLHDQVHADGGDQDGDNQAGQVLKAPVAVGVILVGGLAGELEPQEAHHVAGGVREVVPWLCPPRPWQGTAPRCTQCRRCLPPGRTWCGPEDLQRSRNPGQTSSRASPSCCSSCVNLACQWARSIAAQHRTPVLQLEVTHIKQVTFGILGKRTCGPRLRSPRNACRLRHGLVLAQR